MVKAAQDWQSEHASYPLGVARNRRVLLQRQTRTTLVVKLFVGFEQMTKMLFVEDDDVIKAISADGSDQPFHESILPPASTNS
jgi:hypothetical protein